MKRNLLIGTSLVAALATTSLSARAASAIDKTSFDLNTQVVVTHLAAKTALAAEFDREAVALKAETGSTKAEAGSTLLAAILNNEAGREAVAKILKATTEEAKTAEALRATFDGQTDAQKKATVAKIAEALATNADLRKLVDDFHPLVVAAVKAKKDKCAASSRRSSSSSSR